MWLKTLETQTGRGSRSCSSQTIEALQSAAPAPAPAPAHRLTFPLMATILDTNFTMEPRLVVVVPISSGRLFRLRRGSRGVAGRRRGKSGSGAAQEACVCIQYAGRAVSAPSSPPLVFTPHSQVLCEGPLLVVHHKHNEVPHPQLGGGADLQAGEARRGRRSGAGSASCCGTKVRQM